ncbi:DNA cytosine methyltransferase [Kribbella sp. C-35]|uniref:DNA cytosine methyltransferase n=1 Tax=Kribbella sp. C-35 TaxID=2789276 RepID=UPI00397CEA01
MTLPPGDLLAAGVSCVNHSPANTMKAYEQGLTLFDLEDPDYDDRVTRSERDRATANCVLHHAAQHHPWVIFVECTTQLQSWGYPVLGKRKVGDGSTHRWWLKQFENLGYRYKILYLNSMFFGVGQSRDRGYWVFWKKEHPTPDLEHRPLSWCSFCSEIVESVWTWRTGIPATGTVCYGKQYDYRCARCRRVVIPQFTPSLDAIDLSNLGTRIGDRKRQLASTTLARIPCPLHPLMCRGLLVTVQRGDPLLHSGDVVTKQLVWRHWAACAARMAARLCSRRATTASSRTCCRRRRRSASCCSRSRRCCSSAAARSSSSWTRTGRRSARLIVFVSLKADWRAGTPPSTAIASRPEGTLSYVGIRG